MSQKQKKSVLMAILSALFAWASAFYALWHQISLQSGTSASAFCNVNSYINCDTVALSSFANFMGFPIAGFAMAFYAAFIVLGFLAYFSEIDKNAEQTHFYARWMLLLSLAGVPAILFYSFVSLFVLAALCLSCFAIYLSHLALVLFSYKAKIGSTGSSKDFVQKKSLFAFGSNSLVLIAALGVINLFAPSVLENQLRSGPKIEDSTLSLYVAQHLNNPQFDFSTQNSAVFGSDSAKVTIVSFSDYQCPYCKLAANVIPAIANSYGDKVKLILKDYPLSSECNPQMTHSGHAFSCQAAKATKCALKNLGTEAYKKLSKSIYDKQESLGTDTIKTLSLNSGLTQDQYTQCLSDLGIHEMILTDVKEGTNAGVNSTPAIYVNGRKLDSAVNPQILRMAIEHYLK